MFNHLAVNPGSAGNQNQICASLIARQQWMGIEGAPQTTLAAISTPITPFGIESGIGLTLLSDQLGFYNNFNMKFDYAYRLDLGSGKLGVGLGLGFENRSLQSIAWEAFDPVPQDHTIVQQDDSKLVFDMDFGAFYRNDKFYAGASITHLNGANVEFNTSGSTYLSRHIYLTGGYNFELKDPRFEIEPSIFFKTDGSSMQIDINTNLIYNKKIWGGVTYRTTDAIVALFGIKFGNNLKLGLAYDITTSKLGYNYGGQGSVEIFVGYCFNILKDKTPQKYKSVRIL